MDVFDEVEIYNETDEYFNKYASALPRVNDIIGEAIERSESENKKKYGQPNKPGWIKRLNPDNAGHQFMREARDGYDAWTSSTSTATKIGGPYLVDEARQDNGDPYPQDTLEVFATIPACLALRGRKILAASSMARPANTGVEVERLVSLASGGALVEALALEQASSELLLTLVDADTGNLSKSIANPALQGHIEAATARNLMGEGWTRPGFKQAAGVAALNLVIYKNKQFLSQRGFINDLVLEEGSYDKSEATGIMDYMSDQQIERLATGGIELIKPGGRAFMAQILDTHPDRRFIETVLTWPDMNFRSIEQLEAVFARLKKKMGDLVIKLTIDHDSYACIEVDKLPKPN